MEVLGYQSFLTNSKISIADVTSILGFNITIFLSQVELTELYISLLWHFWSHSLNSQRVLHKNFTDKPSTWSTKNCHLLVELANNAYICCTIKKVTTLLQDLAISKSEVKTMASVVKTISKTYTITPETVGMLCACHSLNLTLWYG